MTTETETGSFSPLDMPTERSSEFLLQSHDTHENEKGTESIVEGDIPEAQDVVKALDQTIQTSKQLEETGDPIAEHGATEVIPIDQTLRDAPAEPEVDAVPATLALPETEADVSSSTYYFEHK